MLHLCACSRAARCGPSPVGSPGHQVRRLGWDFRAGMHQKDKACKQAAKHLPCAGREGDAQNPSWGKATEGLPRPSSTELLCPQTLLPLSVTAATILLLCPLQAPGASPSPPPAFCNA